MIRRYAKLWLRRANNEPELKLRTSSGICTPGVYCPAYAVSKFGNEHPVTKRNTPDRRMSQPHRFNGLKTKLNYAAVFLQGFAISKFSTYTVCPAISATELATRWAVRLHSGFVLCVWHTVLFL